MDKQQALEVLRNHPVFWSRLGFCYDPPLRHADGSLIVMNPTFSEAETHASFEAAGVHIHTCILSSGWTGVEEYDYTLCDRVLSEVFETGNAQWFIPRIKLNVPVDWCRENPEEIAVYHNGPRNAEDIRALVGTLRHDYLGYRSPKGYYNSNGWQDPRPNVDGLISLQSFSSEKWLDDASRALARLVRHIEDSPYGERVLAYHIAYGACGESMMWGRQSSSMWGDYGISHQRHFYEYALKKYGSEEEILKAWGVSSLEGDVVPPPHLRERPHEKAGDFYRDPIADRWSVDYDLFMSEINVNALETFGRVVKENTADKPVGAFYGYIIHMARSPYTGHLGWRRILESPYVDFFAAPKSYYRSGPGEPGGEMAPAVSVNRNKLWLDECDNRTHLSNETSQSAAKNAAETYTVLLRELCKNISHDSGFWFMDLGGGWYADEELMNYVAGLIRASDEVRRLPHKSMAEIAFVVDEESVVYVHLDATRCGEDLLRELQLVGAPVDTLFSFDAEARDLSRIRLAVLPNSCRLDGEYMAELKKAAPNARFLFIGKSLMEKSVVFLDEDGTKYPEFRIVNGGEPMLRDGEGRVTVAVAEDGNFVSGTYGLSAAELREIAERSGVRFFAPVGCAVYADNRMISYFPKEAVTVTLPKGEWRELLTGTAVDVTKPFALLPKDGAAFVKDA